MNVKARGLRAWSATLGVFLGVAAVFVALFFGARGLEDERTRSEFEAAATARIRAVTYALRSDLRLLSFMLVDFQTLLAARVSSRPTFLAIVARELRAFAGELTADEKDVAVISVVLRVPAEGREAFERQAREQIAAAYRLYEFDETGVPVAAAGNGDRYPILASLPTEGTTVLMGLDAASTPRIREALDTARDRAQLVATEPVALHLGDRPSAWIAGAIYHTPIPPTTELRRSEVAGFLLMSLQLEGLFDEALAGLYPSGIDLVLTDLTDTQAPRTLAVHGSRTRSGDITPEAIEASARGESLSMDESIEVADRTWRLSATPSPAFFTLRPGWPAGAILALGLVLALVGAVLVRLAISRRIQIERMVEERTSDLTREIQAKERIETQLKATEQTLVARIADLDRRAAEFLLLNEMGEMMQRCATTEEALAVIARFGLELFPRDTGTLYRYDESLRTVERATGWGQDETSETIFSVDRCWALRGGTAHAVDDPARDLRCPHEDPAASRQSLCLPLAAQGQTIGLLHLAGPRAASTDSTPPLSTRRRLAVTVADQVSPALANIHLREILREQSVRDALTGLYNRRYMEETIRQALHRAQRTKSPLCVLMIDIDHFKRFNDEHGHETGDSLLRSLGAFLRGALRESDTPCRYGGEEFAIILPDATADAGRQRAESLRQRAHDIRVTVGKDEHLGVTLSIGVAAYPEHGLDRDTIVSAADGALYRAKREGRDRVVVA